MAGVKRETAGVKRETSSVNAIGATETKMENYESNSKSNPWKVTALIFGVVIVVLLVFMFRGGITGGAVSESSASEKIVEYLNERTGGGVELVSSEKFGENLYEVTVSYQGEEVPVFVTSDGEYFVKGAIPITGDSLEDSGAQETPQNIQKSDKPKVELFIMTHCPYGTQAEKGFIPVLELLKDKIDGKIRFVHYFMHGDKEEKETYQQLCIREEQSSKYLAYLKCFLEAGDSESCLTKAAIDKSKLSSCLTNKAKEYYEADSKLSQSYGVQGSPTIIINGVEANSGRDSASYLSTICSAFNNAPSECSKQLSSQSPSAGFGSSASGSSGSGSCN